MLSHQHHHLMFYPNSACGLNNGFLYLWPVLLVVMIETIQMIVVVKMGCGAVFEDFPSLVRKDSYL